MSVSEEEQQTGPFHVYYAGLSEEDGWGFIRITLENGDKSYAVSMATDGHVTLWIDGEPEGLEDSTIEEACDLASDGYAWRELRRLARGLIK